MEPVKTGDQKLLETVIKAIVVGIFGGILARSMTPGPEDMSIVMAGVVSAVTLFLLSHGLVVFKRGISLQTFVVGFINGSVIFAFLFRIGFHYFAGVELSLLEDYLTLGCGAFAGFADAYMHPVEQPSKVGK